jgi:apolipoprotein N-acyltransferase
MPICILMLGGLTMAASTAWPFVYVFAHGAPIWWLQCVGLASLCAVLSRCQSAALAAKAALLFATVWLSATFWWLYVAMHTYAGLNAFIAALAVLLLAGALSVYYSLACAIYWRLNARSGWAASLTFAALWTLAEMARGIWLTGFGWGAVSYAHLDGPLAWYIPWVGAYGVGAMAAWVAMTVAQAHRKRITNLIAVAIVLAAPVLVPRGINEWSSTAGTLSVSLLQGNIPQDEKFEQGSGVPMALKWYGEQLQASTSELVVAPETAIAVLPQQLPEEYWRRLRERFATGHQAALIGIPLGSFNEGYTNSVLGLSSASAAAWRYDKQHLVPFGEFIPPLFKWFTTMMNIPLGDFNRGDLGQPSFAVAGQRLAVNICYEDLFAEELAQRFTDVAAAPTIFVNVSNIGWFGDTVAIDQHLQISRMRVLEFQRPFVRATNTGATAILDHRGHTVAALPRLTRGVLVGSVEGRTGLTPFAWWVSRMGLWPLWILALGVVAWVWLKQSVNPRPIK